jgi:hypothetical protein
LESFCSRKGTLSFPNLRSIPNIFRNKTFTLTKLKEIVAQKYPNAPSLKWTDFSLRSNNKFVSVPQLDKEGMLRLPNKDDAKNTKRKRRNSKGKYAEKRRSKRRKGAKPEKQKVVMRIDGHGEEDVGPICPVGPVGLPHQNIAYNDGLFIPLDGLLPLPENKGSDPAESPTVVPPSSVPPTLLIPPTPPTPTLPPVRRSKRSRRSRPFEPPTTVMHEIKTGLRTKKPPKPPKPSVVPDPVIQIPDAVVEVEEEEEEVGMEDEVEEEKLLVLHDTDALDSPEEKSVSITMDSDEEEEDVVSFATPHWIPEDETVRKKGKWNRLASCYCIFNYINRMLPWSLINSKVTNKWEKPCLSFKKIIRRVYKKYDILDKLEDSSVPLQFLVWCIASLNNFGEVRPILFPITGKVLLNLNPLICMIQKYRGPTYAVSWSFRPTPFGILVNYDNRKEKRIPVEDIMDINTTTKDVLHSIPKWVYELCVIEEEEE